MSQSVDKTKMEFDEKVQFEVKLSWPGTASTILVQGLIRPELSRLKLARVSSSVSSIGSGADETTVKSYFFELSPTVSGLARIEPIEINYISFPDSIPGLLMTDPVEIEIAKPSLKISSDESELNLLLIAAFVLLGGGLISGVMFYRRSNSTQSEPVRSAEKSFCLALTKLQNETRNDHKQFQTGLYRLLINYLESRFDISGKGRPCEEVVTLLKETNMPPSQREKIAGWLQSAEREKYSPLAASPGETIRLESELQEFFQSIP